MVGQAILSPAERPHPHRVWLFSTADTSLQLTFCKTLLTFSRSSPVLRRHERQNPQAERYLDQIIRA